MEVSSHALSQDRVAGVRFQRAVYTNLTQDHLDFHADLSAYRKAKKTLFSSLQSTAVAVYNSDDPHGDFMVSDIHAETLSYGQNQRADIRFEILGNDREGLRLRLDGYTQTFRLVGSFNAYNLSAAYGTARALDYQSGDILEALAAAPPVPGRFEQIQVPDGPLVVVDYAHTPDALANVLRAARTILPSGGRLISVFGCGGDRDRSKRPIMGAAAERYADVVIATSDNPRTEDPQAILADIRSGLAKPGAAGWIVDRRAAIAEAASMSRGDDIVVIAGKGHETYQVIGTRKVSFDDREVARTAFGINDARPS
jgi:UDP-N-acetylmuramoyl-L-alanyl-D-glutamate--2,6-diaminopimelate ligase